ncbi:META domain-containing protein [Helicobacter kayseriensis]|uniref:META domain-containing protein n=1 Tax=Helicobacter kayseriensis TaxID=2905877 RepID=UPI001E5373D1|nr:META domain-containing protein [Helicobacter kayseriensis]MCE3046618.1 META domain-containing protein [Helicobacter kayseriensis]MCE3048080.1 META domain-containing protein [Helicobacter kayseriensis]
MRIFCSVFYMAMIAILLNGCFFANIFDFGPKIDLGKNKWKISSFVLGDVKYEPKGYEEIPNMRFDTKELKLYGNTGCNAFFATYTWLNDQKIEMRNSGLTRKMCASEDAMKFEQKLMEEFDGDFEVTEEKDDLILKREDLQITLTPLDENEAQTQKTSQ